MCQLLYHCFLVGWGDGHLAMAKMAPRTLSLTTPHCASNRYSFARVANFKVVSVVIIILANAH